MISDKIQRCAILPDPKNPSIWKEGKPLLLKEK